MPEYAFILVLFLIAGIFLHRYYQLHLYRNTKHMVTALAVIFVLGVAWDQFAFWRGHWFLGEQFMLGPRIGYMPIEEYGFIFVMTYFWLVIYKLFEKRFGK